MVERKKKKNLDCTRYYWILIVDGKHWFLRFCVYVCSKSRNFGSCARTLVYSGFIFSFLLLHAIVNNSHWIYHFRCRHYLFYLSWDVLLKLFLFTKFSLFLWNLFQGHGHWVNSLALSTEYVLRTGAFDHTGKKYSSPEEMQKVIWFEVWTGNIPALVASQDSSPKTSRFRYYFVSLSPFSHVPQKINKINKEKRNVDRVSIDAESTTSVF